MLRRRAARRLSTNVYFPITNNHFTESSLPILSIVTSSIVRSSTDIKRQGIIDALIALHGATVTRAQLIAFEERGLGNCAFVGKLYKGVVRGTYDLTGVPSVSTGAPSVKAPRAARVAPVSPVAVQMSAEDEHATVSLAVPAGARPTDVLKQLEALVAQSSALAKIPERSPAFVAFGDFDIIRQIIKSKHFHPVFITGLSGNGKTFQIEQACAIEKVEHIRVNISIETDEDDLIGGFRLKNGETVFELGPIPVAMMRGCPITIDEIDLASPKIMCLQSVLEGRPLTIKKLGVTIAPKPGFTVFATANTKGRGSDDGRFVGTNLLSEAFLERFPITIEQAYPSIAIEKKILAKTYEQLGGTETAESNVFMETLARWAETIRVTYFEDGIEDLISTRRLVHIVKTYAIFGDQQQALTLCLHRFEPSVQAKFLDLYKKFAPDTEGEPVIPVITVEPVVAAFDPSVNF